MRRHVRRHLSPDTLLSRPPANQCRVLDSDDIEAVIIALLMAGILPTSITRANVLVATLRQALKAAVAAACLPAAAGGQAGAGGRAAGGEQAGAGGRAAAKGAQEAPVGAPAASAPLYSFPAAWEMARRYIGSIHRVSGCFYRC